jgi:GNAT superfamily N-acetyltransferase
MVEVTFEAPTIEDAAQLLEAQIRAFHDDARLYPGVELGGPPNYDSLPAVIREIQEDLYHKIVHEGKIIGALVVFDYGGGHYHLDKIFVDPEYHNRGVGTQAMQFLEKTYPAAVWTLDTPAYAVRNHHFYEKLGYVKEGEKVEDGNFRLFCYRKTLKPETNSG